VKFESFFLVKNGNARLPASQEEHDLLFKAFFIALSIAVVPPFLVVQFKSLPPKPWPLTVAGLPLVYTTDENDMGYRYERLGGRPIKALPQHDARQSLINELFDAAINHFEQILSISIISILNLAGLWIITVQIM
jgi:hypothetical protein